MTSKILPAAVLVLLIASFLRFHQLDAQSFWNDRGQQCSSGANAIAQIIEGTASDVHPPLYYLVLHAWREAAGDSEFGLRALSALAGILTVAATIALARSVSRNPVAVALIAGLLAAAIHLLFTMRKRRACMPRWPCWQF
ncbi:MAG: glycosyltransferase family 39 protein [Chloroflexota bacterium]